MFAKQFVTGVFAAALLSTTALAQAPAPAAKDPAPTGQSTSMPRADTPARPVENQSASEWRGSKVIGLYVYNDANERLGSINDLLMDSSGKISKAVIGVGGFLGIGESDVAIDFSQLKFAMEAVRVSTAPTPPATTTGSSSTTTTTMTATTVSKPSVNPDHAKLSMTKDQLKALPQFKYAN